VQSLLRFRTSGSVQASFYLIFNERLFRDLRGCIDPRRPVRGKLSGWAGFRELMPKEPENRGLLVLMLLQDFAAGSPDRAGGELITLEIRTGRCGIGTTDREGIAMSRHERQVLAAAQIAAVHAKARGPTIQTGVPSQTV